MRAPATTTAAPRPHHHRRIRHTHTAAVLGLGFALWLFIGLVPLHLLHNTAMAQTWFLLGAALVPGTLLWIMAHRLRPSDTITGEKLVQTTAIGGVLAVTVGGTLDALTRFIPQPVFGQHGVVTLALAGPIEEFAKAVLVVVLGWRVAKTARNGLFLGGAVGIGFAIFETMYYISNSFAGNEPLLTASRIFFERGLLSPLMHPLWSALLGAAIFAAASATGRFRLTLGVVGTYLGVAALHGIWDSAGPLVGVAAHDTGVGALAAYGFMLVAALTGGFTWRHVARRLEPQEPETAAIV